MAFEWSQVLRFAAVLVLAAVVFASRGRMRFNWAAFLFYLRQASVGHLAAGVGLILGTNWLRSTRWAVFLSPVKRIRPFALVGAQMIGFTAVALFGRMADLTRPYLVSRRVGMSVSSQIGVYTIERMFDLGAAAMLFSGALALTPRGAPHHEAFARAGLVALAGTVLLGAFAGTIGIFGERVAATLGRPGSAWFSRVGGFIGGKIADFREGLRAVSGARVFVLALVLSLAIWGMIGEAYVQTAHAFVRTPELATLSFSRTMLLLAVSLGGSLVQLPVVGWFTQIAVTATAMHTLYGAPVEAATACGAVLFLVVTLSVVPAGLVCGRLERISLGRAARGSGAEEAAT